MRNPGPTWRRDCGHKEAIQHPSTKRLFCCPVCNQEEAERTRREFLESLGLWGRVIVGAFAGSQIQLTVHIGLPPLRDTPLIVRPAPVQVRITIPGPTSSSVLPPTSDV